MGWLSVGIGSSVYSMFIVGFVSQWWLRTRHPRWFAKYNYILAAGLDGGTQVRSISNHSILISYTKPCWAGHGFHSLVCCSRSIWEVPLNPAVVRAPLLRPTLMMHTDVCYRWGANQGGWSNG